GAQQDAPSSNPAPVPSAFPTSWTKKPPPEDAPPPHDEAGRGTSNADDSVRSGTSGEEKKPVPHPALPPEVPHPANWDFEPADAKSSVKPPEESLFFAAA